MNHYFFNEQNRKQLLNTKRNKNPLITPTLQ